MFKLSNFKQEIHNNGILRNNRYLVSFNAPLYLASEPGMEKLTLRCESAQMPGVTFATIDGAPRFGYGPIESNPYGVIFDDATLTFLLDAKANIHNFFYKWSNSIVNYQSRGQTALKDAYGPVKGMKTFEVGYKDKYVTDITITVYSDSSTGKGTTDMKKVMETKLYRAFPKNLPQFDLSWNTTNDMIRLPISFNYTDFSTKYF